MSHIATFLTYKDQAEDAAKLYTSIFPNSRITRVTHYPDIDGLPPAGSVMTVEFELMGQPFVALNGGPHFSFSQGISISVQCDTQQEVDEYWAKLAEGGQEIACGWLTDKFGVSWQINPKMLMEMIADTDPNRAQKAMQAMMGMVKINSEVLRKAWE